jgi:hypothetical protein
MFRTIKNFAIQQKIISATHFTMMDIDQHTDHSTGITRVGGGSGILSAEASRLFRVYKTIGAMLSKRGYMVSREMREMSPMEFIHKFGEFPSREGLTILVVSCK